MSSADNSVPRDSLGYLRRLQQVLQLPALGSLSSDGQVSPESNAAAYLLIETLGYCQLYDIEIPEDISVPITPPIALAACRHLQLVLDAAQKNLERLPERWDLAISQLEIDAICYDLLSVRMNVWAAFVVAEEIASTMSPDDPAHGSLHESLDAVAAELLDFDETLRGDAELLATVADTKLLENWRSMLAGDFVIVLPWWLDGTLERAAERTHQRNYFGINTNRKHLVERAATSSHSTNELRAIREPLRMAAKGQSARPYRKTVRWSSEPEGKGYHAELQLPTIRAIPRTDLELRFRPVVTSNRERMQVELLGARVCLGFVDSKIVRRNVGDDDFVIYARFVVEELLRHQLRTLDLSVDGRVWYAIEPDASVTISGPNS